MIRTIKTSVRLALALTALTLMAGCGHDEHHTRTTTDTNVTHNPDGSTTTSTTQERKY